MDADEVDGLFEPRILERGRRYARDGHVRSVMEMAPRMFHGEVEGGRLYDVMIRMDDGSVASATCTCPYAMRGRRCKHMAAVCLAMADGPSGCGDDSERNGQTPDAAAGARPTSSGRSTVDVADDEGPGPVTTDTYGKVHDFFVAWYGEHGPFYLWDPDVDGEWPEAAISGGMRYPTLNEEQAKRMAGETIRAYRAYMEDDGDGWNDDDWDDGEHGPDVLAGVRDVLSNALFADDPVLAARNIATAMTLARSVSDHMVDDDRIEDEIDGLVGMVRMFFERIAGDPAIGAGTCTQVAEPILTMCIADDRPCDAYRGILCGTLSFSRRMRTRTVADGIMERLERSEGHGADPEWASFVLRLRHDDLLLAHECDRARRFAEDHPESGDMTMLTVAKAMIDDDMDAVGKAVERHLQASGGRRNGNDGDGSLSRGALPGDTFPHGWTTVLVARAQRLGDRDGLERLYAGIIVGGDDAASACVDRLRALVGGGCWRRHVRGNVIRRCLSTRRENGALEHLLASEHMHGEILRYCEEHHAAIDRLYDEIRDVYPREATALLLAPYDGDRAFVGVVPRERYRDAAERLRRVIPAMGREWVRDRARRLASAYPRRRNLRIALKELM